tara:strand:- start:19774 stop:21168 length:1395 start_codon:yes stop_codon:yes gene_type:complete
MIKFNKYLEAGRALFKAPILVILLITLTVLLLNIPILVTLWRHSFDDGTYSHAYLIPFISLYLFHELQSSGRLIFRNKLSVPATILLVSSCMALFITSNAQISLGYWCSLLAVLITSINMLFKFNKHIAFPSVYLVFILPIWGSLTTLLQSISVKAVTFIMSFTGIPTFVEGNYVTIPAGVFEIADGCSGLRYLIVSLAISSLFCFLYIKTPRKVAIFFSLAILGALITNWIRITALILIGEYTNMESSLMEDHNTFGWYLFIPFMITLFWWGNKLADSDVVTKLNSNSVPNKPKRQLVGILFLTLVLSSTGVKSFLYLPKSITIAQAKPAEIMPIIQLYSSVKRKELSTNNNVYLVFNFNANDLDEKPSYFANDILPKGHTAISKETQNAWSITFARSYQNKAVILHKYEIDHGTYTNLTAFKLARLKKAILNINNTKLHWIYLTCNDDCNQVMEEFLMADKN